MEGDGAIIPDENYVFLNGLIAEGRNHGIAYRLNLRMFGVSMPILQ